MPAKRGPENGETSNFRSRKKQKLADARAIPVQALTPPGQVAGPSRLGPIANDSSKQLPGAIDVERFAEARAFEINAMQTAMKTARQASTTRAWQVLPRHLRRRAASHDVRRVPLRLRDKARAEMDPVKRKALGRSMPKLGKAKRLPRTEVFRRRQREKRWLETHIWHAKRMKMEDMWGYRLAVTPTEKAFRPSHRASLHGSILHDASYQSLVELKGPGKVLRSILEMCCDVQGPSPGTQRFASGSRICSTHIYGAGDYPYNLICPASIMWKPLSVAGPAGLQNNTSMCNIAQGKGKQSAPASNCDKENRAVWLWFHPAVFDEVFTALRTSTSLVLDNLKRAGSPEVEVELADVRGQIGMFEVMGPKSNQVLRGALSPVMTDVNDDFKRFWTSLGSLQSSGSVPTGMIIGFDCYDPRLKFPPKDAKVKAPTGNNVSPPMPVFPTAALASSRVWDQSVRDQLKKPRYTKQSLDERREKHLIPGTPLNPLRKDDRVPVILIQRSIQAPGLNDTEAIYGWTLIFPAGWSMAFLSQLTFTGTRVGGQRERKTQAFEAGAAYFPHDYPATRAYQIHAAQRRIQEKSKWMRTPPAKRINYQKLGTRSPWVSDWEVVLGIKEAQTEFSSEAGEDLVSTQREEQAEASLVEDQDGIIIDGAEPSATSAQPWLLRGSDVTRIISNIPKVFFQGQKLLQDINELRGKRSLKALDPNLKPDDLFKGAIVTVRVSMCLKGSPGDLAIIYSIPDHELRDWQRSMKEGGGLVKDSVGEEVTISLANSVPSESAIIGYITSGGFSLSRGDGYAIGAISLSKLLELQQQSDRFADHTGSSDLLVRVRDRGGHQCRLAGLQVLQN